jgi:hypothetical protein
MPVETSGGCLPPDEGHEAAVSWKPTVQSEFDRLLVYDLAERGAASIDELQQREFRFDGVALSRGELVSLVESARRRGLVEPLGHASRASGEEVKATEWAATARGHDLDPPARVPWMNPRRRFTQMVQLTVPKMWPIVAIFLALAPLSSLAGAFGDDSNTKLLVTVYVILGQVVLVGIAWTLLYISEPKKRAVRVAYEWPSYRAAGKPLPPEWAGGGDVPKDLPSGDDA